MKDKQQAIEMKAEHVQRFSWKNARVEIYTFLQINSGILVA